MDLLQANSILKSLDKVTNVVNTTIGVLHASVELLQINTIELEMICQDNSGVGKFLLEDMVNNALQNNYPFKVWVLEDRIKISYKLESSKGNDIVKYNNKIVSIIIDMLYLAVDAAKIEYCLIIDKDNDNELPFVVLDEIDQWNEDQEYNEEEDFKPIEYTDVKHYKMNKKCLYGVSLGYYDININLVESDLVPELIGVLFESTEDFCYVISDDEYIHFYSVVPFNEDIEFDIEEGLINNLHLLSETNQEETLEEIWEEMRCYNE